MALYRISLLKKDGSLAEEYSVEREDDDAAIDHAGRLDHPHEMRVWQGKRLVATFPAWTGPLAT